MIIKYNSQEKLKNGIEELITLHINFKLNLTEKDLYSFLQDAKDHEIYLQMEPDVNLGKGRDNWGWKHSTLRYFVASDAFSMYLPNPEPLSTDSEQKDIQKASPEEDLIQISKPELLRELKALDIQLSKLIKKVEGGQW